MKQEEHLPSKKIKALFDEELLEIFKNKQSLSFSVERILDDLIEAGIAPLDALDILYKTRPYLSKGMQTEALIRIFNQEIKSFGYSDSEFLYATYFQPVEILFPNNEAKIFNFKVIKEIVANYFLDFEYSSKTFREIVSELHRIIKTLRTESIKLDTITQMMPLVSRNVLAVDPFAQDRCVDDYANVVKLTSLIQQNWEIIPELEVKDQFLNLFESAFRVILLSYEYLPGSSLLNTIHQVHVLVTDLISKKDRIMSAHEIYTLGKSAKRIQELFNDQFVIKANDRLFSNITTVTSVVNGLMNRGAISWLIVSDINGNELFSKFGSNQRKKANKSLIAMAISGIQSIVSELTDSGIREIQQDLGQIIIIEKRELFYVGTLIKQTSHLVRQRIIELANFVEGNLSQALIKFNGSVTIFNNTIDEYVKSRMIHLFN